MVFCNLTLRSFLLMTVIGVFKSYVWSINGQLFHQELAEVANEALGVSDMQTEYNRLSYSKTPLNGKEVLNNLKNAMDRKINGLEGALKIIKHAVQDNYYKFTNSHTMTLCCEVTGGTFDYRYRSEVNHDEACIAQSTTEETNKKFASSEIVKEMKKNYEDNPNVLWQYFAGNDGTFIIYPSVKMASCEYDPRYRPYYVSGASPVPKDVVIVLDRSGSMTTEHQGRNLLQMAQEATVTVINALTPNDRIGIVAFASSAETPGSRDSSGKKCYTDNLAIATTENKRTMSVFINSLNADGRTNYADAINKAFDYFINSKQSIQGEERDKVILFLTDGDNADAADPLAVIRDKNKLLNNTVLIHTYGIGQFLSEAGLNLLKNMSAQTLNDISYGETKHGRSQKIEDITDLRIAISSYYSYFARDRQTATTFSVPYLDEFSKSGLISSLCLPTYVSGSFKGVVCTDLKLSDILSDISYFQRGSSSYAFIIDGLGRALVHPLLPRPENIDDDPSFYDIKYFERSSEAASVIESMKSGNTGEKTFRSVRTVSRGSMLLEGVTTDTVISHYYWSKVPDSNFSLCVVIGDNDSVSRITPVPVPNANVFVYHRRDIHPGSLKNCRHYARFATVEKTCVMLTPSAFKEPFKYLDEAETEIKIESYKRYLTGIGNVDAGVKETVRDSVTQTYKAEAIWKRLQENAKYVIWRYIVTTDGIVRMYPGVQLAKDYDMNQRPWYRRTLANKDMYVLHAPYLDAWGSGYLISLTRTLFDKSSSNVKSVVAVMGTDFPVRYFYQMLVSTYKQCVNSDVNSCMIIDNSGFIVIHPSFVEPLTDPKLDRLYNIVEKEGDIALDLIQKGILTRTHCSDFRYGKKQYTYRVILTQTYSQGVNEEGYELSAVTDSNVFVLIKKTNARQFQTCCTDGSVSAERNKCGSNGICGCLCYGDLIYSVCNNEYDTGDSSQTCNSRAPSLKSVSQNEIGKIKTLATCFELDCNKRQNETQCYSIAGCNWCSYTQNKKALQPNVCRLKETCPFGQCADDVACLETPPGKNVSEPVGSDSNALTIGIGVGIGVGVLVGILLVVLVIVLICRRRRRKGDDPYLHAIPAISAKEESNPHPQSQSYVELYGRPETHVYNRYGEMPTAADNST